MTSYRNPILGGFHPDPSVCRVGEDYYLVTSSFEFFPGIPVYHSHDLIHWKLISYCLTRKSQLNLDGAMPSGGLWAPTIRFHDGLFHMTTTNTTHGWNFFVTPADPAGPWSEPVWVDLRGIDPSFFFDDDGKVYYLTNAGLEGRRGIVMAQIDPVSGKFLSPVRFVWGGLGGLAPEGPHLYKINGLYYLMLAEGGTYDGHMVTIARSRDPWGPYEPCPRNPILTHRNIFHTIQATGHGELIHAHDGSWWMMHLAVRRIDQGPRLARETYLAPVKWDAQGWPVVGNDGIIELEMQADCLPAKPWPAEPMRDDFDLPALGLHWNFLRNPAEGIFDLTAKPGWLGLRGRSVGLDDIDSPAMVCRRQEHLWCRCATLLDFDPAEGEEAGLTVFRSHEYHYDLAVTMQSGRRKLVFRRTMGDLKVVVAAADLASGPVVLEVEAQNKEYIFRYGAGRALPATAPLTELARARAHFLSNEVTGSPFTGVFVGLYATGPGQPSANTAWFDWFDYEPGKA